MDRLPTAWPVLRVDDWTDTREALHLWLQIVGKLELGQTDLINHWWNVSYEVSARGLRTRLMHGKRPFDAEFDFMSQALVIRAGGGQVQTVPLRSQTVAAFYAQVVEACARLDLACVINDQPNEVSPAVPFSMDTAPRQYDGYAARVYWQQLLRVEEVFSSWRAGFAGKASPVQLFWGSMDLSATRFSGRVAPPHEATAANCPVWVMTEAESRENAAAGFWPGGSEEGSFYAYCYPAPHGYRDAALSAGSFDAKLGEWILPYRDVRTSGDPEKTLLTFLGETYDLAADLGRWDRATLDVDPHRLDAEHRRT